MNGVPGYLLPESLRQVGKRGFMVPFELDFGGVLEIKFSYENESYIIEVFSDLTTTTEFPNEDEYLESVVSLYRKYHELREAMEEFRKFTIGFV